jgi:hypothetical protein
VAVYEDDGYFQLSVDPKALMHSTWAHVFAAVNDTKVGFVQQPDTGTWSVLLNVSCELDEFLDLTDAQMISGGEKQVLSFNVINGTVSLDKVVWDVYSQMVYPVVFAFGVCFFLEYYVPLQGILAAACFAIRARQMVRHIAGSVLAVASIVWLSEVMYNWHPKVPSSATVVLPDGQIVTGQNLSDTGIYAPFQTIEFVDWSVAMAAMVVAHIFRLVAPSNVHVHHLARVLLSLAVSSMFLMVLSAVTDGAAASAGGGGCCLK